MDLNRRVSAGRLFPRAALPAPHRSAQAFTAALGVLAFVAAHQLAYLLGQAPDRAGHGYLRVVETSAAAVLAVAVVLFAVAARRSGASRDELVVLLCRPQRLVATCVVAPALIFVLVEFCERSFAAPPGLPLVIGVGLQLLFGCASLLGSRRLLRFVVAVVARPAARFVPGRTSAGGRRRPPRAPRWGSTVIRQANHGRAPPVV